MHRHGRRILQNFLRYDGPPCMAQLIVKKKLGDLTMCHCEGKGVGDGVAVGDGEIRFPTRVLRPIRGAGLGGLAELTRRLLEQPQALKANTNATESVVSCEMRSPPLATANCPPVTGLIETGAQNSTGGVFVKNKSSCRRHPRLGLRLNVMFLLLMIVYTPSTRSPLALAAESEPIVSLPGGVPPQAAELLAAATPARAEMLLHIRIYLQLRDKQAAEK